MSSLVVSGDTSGSVTIAAPAVAGSGTLTLPVATDTLVGKATTDTLTNKSIAATQLTGTIAVARLPAGSVIRVEAAYKTDVQTITASMTFVDISGLSITITPASASSTFLIIWNVTMGNAADASHGYVRLNRSGTPIALADTAGSRTSASSAIINTSGVGQTIPSGNSFLDSPATGSAITYKLTAASNAAGASTFINRSSRDDNNANFDGRSTSSLTILEIGG